MRTAKTVSLCLALLLVGSLSAHGASRGRRVEQAAYTGGGIAEVVGLSAAGQENVGAARFQSGPERYVSVSVEDASGRPVVGEVVQLGGDPDQPPLTVHEFCATTERPVRVRPNLSVHVYVYYGQGCDGEVVSAPTRGTIEAVFTKS